MAKKGRPFTYQSDEDKPVTISMRLPKELHARLERYAKQYRQSISELMRDGIEWRIGEGDPRSLREGVGANSPQEYYDNTGSDTLAEIRADNERVLQEVLHGFAQQESQIESLLRVLEQRLPPESNGLYDSNTENAPSVVQDGMVPRVKVDKEEVIGRIQQMRDKGLDSAQIAETLQAEGVPTLSAEAQLQVVVDMLEHRAGEDCSEGITRSTSPASMATMPAVQPTVLQVAQSPALASVEAPPFDTTRYRLGKLCPKGHAFGGTGQSLLRTHNHRCWECENASRREKRQARRQAPAPEQRPGGALPDTVLPYDPTTRRLGKLCPRGHDYLGTGQSLRTTHKSGYCLACNAERVRERRQATVL